MEYSFADLIKIGKGFLVLSVVAAAGAALIYLPVRQCALQLQSHIEDLGVLGPVVFVLAYIALTVVLAPVSGLTIAAGTIFGLRVGGIVAFAGANLGALTSFLIARTFMRKRLARWAATNPKFAAIRSGVASGGFKIVTLARLSPVLPFPILNYLLGLTGMSVGPYILANLIGMLPGISLYVYVGATAREVIGEGAIDASRIRRIFMCIGLLATIGVVMLVTRKARHRFCGSG